MTQSLRVLLSLLSLCLSSGPAQFTLNLEASALRNLHSPPQPDLQTLGDEQWPDSFREEGAGLTTSHPPCCWRVAGVGGAPQAASRSCPGARAGSGSVVLSGLKTFSVPGPPAWAPLSPPPPGDLLSPPGLEEADSGTLGNVLSGKRDKLRHVRGRCFYREGAGAKQGNVFDWLELKWLPSWREASRPQSTLLKLHFLRSSALTRASVRVRLPIAAQANGVPV